MEILQAAKKIPGGLTVVPLLLGIIVNIFFGNALWSTSDDTFITYLWKSGAMPILVVFTFYNAITTNLKKAGVTVYKGMLITAVEAGVGITIELICGTLPGEKGFLGLSTLAIVGALANPNDGLYAALAGEYGGATDVGAVSTLSISDGPFFTMVVLRIAGAAKIPMFTLIGCVVLAIVGCILSNLDEDIHKFCEPDITMLIPFFAFPPGAGLNIMSLLKVEGLRILLGIACTLIAGLAGCLAYKLLRVNHPEVDGAIGITAGNAAATPASVATVDTISLVVAEAVTTQITVAIVVTTILCSVLAFYLHKIEAHKRGR